MSRNVILKDIVTSGSNDRSAGNAQFTIDCNGVVEVKDCTFGQSGYNVLEIGLKKGYAPKHIIEENSDFKGDNINNGISIYGWQDGANIILRNCTFGKLSNPVRISNKLNNTCNIVFENVTVEQWEEGDYAGFILMQDYTSATEEEAIANNLFANTKINITFKNVRYPNGDLIMPENVGDVCSGGNLPQVAYVYRNQGGLIAYREDVYPTMTFQA